MFSQEDFVAFVATILTHWAIAPLEISRLSDSHVQLNKCWELASFTVPNTYGNYDECLQIPCSVTVDYICIIMETKNKWIGQSKRSRLSIHDYTEKK